MDGFTEDCKNFEDDFISGFSSDGVDDVFIDLETSDDTSDADGKSRDDFEEVESKYVLSVEDFKAGFDSVDDEAGDDASVEEMNFVDSEAGCVPDSFEDVDCDPL